MKTFKPEREDEIKRTLAGLVRDAKNAGIVFLVSGFSPFMGQTSDIDDYFIYTVMKKHRLRKRNAVRVLFSPASYFPEDQATYARGFKDYYEDKLGVKTVTFSFPSFYYLHKIETVLEILPSYLECARRRCDTREEDLRWILAEIGATCLFSRSGEAMYIERLLFEAEEDLVEKLVVMAGEKLEEEKDSANDLLIENVFLNLLERGPSAVPDIVEWLEKYREGFLKDAGREYRNNKKIFGNIHAFYGGGGNPEVMIKTYDYPVGNASHWPLFEKAWRSGIPFLGYSAHAILLGQTFQERIPYDEDNLSLSLVQSLKRHFAFIRQRKRDFWVMSPMKGLVPLSLLVHYEREVADLRKFELNYFDETVPEDVMSLRNNCAVACFCRPGGETRIMGLWSSIAPPTRDQTSEIRYIHYKTGKPCKLHHGEVRTIMPNPPFQFNE